MQAEHLPDLHCGALHFTQRNGDAGPVADHVLCFLQSLRGAVPQQTDCLIAEHRDADTANQPAHSDEPAQRRGIEFIASHDESQRIDGYKSGYRPGAAQAFTRKYL